MEGPSLYAIGAFIQSLGQNPGLETLLQQLGSQAHVYIGTGLGAIDASYEASIHLYRTQKRWDAFWADPAHNSVLAAHQASAGQAIERRAAFSRIASSGAAGRCSGRLECLLDGPIARARVVFGRSRGDRQSQHRGRCRQGQAEHPAGKKQATRAGCRRSGDRRSRRGRSRPTSSGTFTILPRRKSPFSARSPGLHSHPSPPAPRLESRCG